MSTKPAPQCPFRGPPHTGFAIVDTGDSYLIVSRPDEDIHVLVLIPYRPDKSTADGQLDRLPFTKARALAKKLVAVLKSPA